MAADVLEQIKADVNAAAEQETEEKEHLNDQLDMLRGAVRLLASEVLALQKSVAELQTKAG